MTRMSVRSTHVTTGLQDWAAGEQRVAYENLLEAAGVSIDASSADSDFSADLAGNWFAGDQKWKATTSTDPEWIRADLGSAKEVTTFAIYGHNLGTIGATVELQHATSAGGPWTTLGLPWSPTDDSVIFRYVASSATKRYWRLKISSPSAAPVIAIWFLGESLRLHSGPPDGFQPPGMNHDDDIMNSESDGGEFLGRSRIRRGNESTVSVRTAPPSWIRDNYLDFLEAARVHPFFWAWNNDSYPDEAVLAWSQGGIGGPQYTNGGAFMDHSFTVQAR